MSSRILALLLLIIAQSARSQTALEITSQSILGRLNVDTYCKSSTDVKSLIFFRRMSHQGYSDDGTVKWPNGQTLLLRHAGYSDDNTMYYPDGRVWRLKHAGYSDDGTIKWPSVTNLYLRHAGYSDDDGSVFHSNGSSWVKRHIGYSDDGLKTAPDVETVIPNATYTVTAWVEGSLPMIRIKYQGTGFRVLVILSSVNADPIFTECVL